MPVSDTIEPSRKVDGALSSRFEKPGDEWSQLARQLVWTQDKVTGTKMPGMLTTTGLLLDETKMRKKAKELLPRDKQERFKK